MPPPTLSRRHLLIQAAAVPAMLGARGLATAEAAAPPEDVNGLGHAAESIHQEVTFDASRRRLYQALTNAKQFDAVTRLSDAVALLTAPTARPTSISAVVGGAFTLFGGYITGRNLDMRPGERLVQAWRAESWKPGEFSIVRFVLQEEGSGTRLIFDHGGFPAGQGVHLAVGWHVHYWEPLVQFLAQP